MAASIHVLAQRMQATGSIDPYIPWSDVLVPWLWLCAEESSSNAFCEALAQLAAEVPALVGTHTRSEYVRALWQQTRFALQAIGITTASGLLHWLHGQRAHMLQWMQADSRYCSSPVRPPTPAVAQHLHDYEQEYIVSQLICLLYTSPSPRDRTRSRMPSSA